MSKDYYNILNIDKSASEADIKKAYRRMAHKYHPDKDGGDETKFKEVNEAYQVLGNPQKKQQYDQFGTTFDQAGAGGQGPFGGFGGHAGGFNINFEDLGDMFGDFFGGGGGRTRRRAKGQDVVIDVTLSFAESVLGVEKTIKLRLGVDCAVCSGSGAEPGTGTKSCGTCNGSGQVTQMQRTILGAMQSTRVCDTCSGQGSVPETPCKHCRGVGVEKRETETTVRIPAGIADGNTIKFLGKGEASLKKGDRGDLFVRIHVQTDDRFMRDGFDLRATEYLNFSQAALGDTITVQTVDGEVKLKIPSGTQSGTVFRVRGKGVADRGDLYITAQVNVPKKMNRKAKKLLEQLEQELS